MKDQTIDTKSIARWINERGLQDIAAFLVDVARPFGIFIAQTTYFIEPLFGGRHHLLQDLGAIFEDPDQMKDLLDQFEKDTEDHG